MKKRSKHSLSFQRLQSMDMGYLYPTGFVEVLPGDSMRFAQSAFARFSPLVNPVMAKISLFMYRFFVPYRTLDEYFEEMITGGFSNDTDFITPQMTVNSSNWVEGGIMDYMGVGNPGKNSISICSYPFRAYNFIWNNFFRDQDLMAEAYFDKEVREDNPASFGILPVAWEKDYYTIARPWQMKGQDVSIPVQGGSSQPVELAVVSNQNNPLFTVGGITDARLITGSSGNPGTSLNLANGPSLAALQPIFGSQTGLKASGVLRGDIGFITPDDLRLAMSLQRFGENRARFGSRYSEYLRMLGVRPQDMRLDLPEYIGGGMSTMQLSEVLQTSPTDGQPVGHMAGHGVGVARSKRTRHFFPEHGLVMFLALLRPKSLYTNTIPRAFLRKTRFDFWQPELQHLGQQEITNKELNASNDNPDGVFGYSDRYNEYRFNQSQVCGEFRSLLKDWHLGRILPDNTTLNADFVRCQPRTDIFSVTDPNYNKVYCSFSHSIQARRLITPYAQPSLR